MNMERMQGIQPLWNKTVSQQEQNVQPDGLGMFADIFNTAIQQVKDTDAKKNEMEYLMATGQLDNPAEWSIASQQALSSVQLLAQLRNKALESYNELMRISL